MEDQNPDKPKSNTIKIIVVGSMAVGKTCLIAHYQTGKFLSDIPSTCGSSFVQIKKTVNGKKYTLNLWDTAGQEKYRALAKVYYKSANAVVLVYDITSAESFKVMKEYWYEQVKEVDTENFIIAIAANKSDLYEERKVEDKEGEEFAQSIGAIFVPTSAKNESGATALFENIARKILDPSFAFVDEEKKKKLEYEQKKKEEQINKKKTEDLLHKNDKMGKTQSFRISTKTVKETDEKQKKKKCC